MIKKRKIVDPCAGREAEKYDNPIPSREYILSTLEDAGKPLSQKKIQSLLQIKTPEQEEALRRRLGAMIRDAQLVQNRRGKYGLIDKLDLIAGRVIAHRDGHGFITPEEGDEELYVSAREMRQVFHGDKVLVRISSWHDYFDKPCAQIVEVVERGTTHVVGRLQQDGNFYFVEPENKHITRDVAIASDCLGDAKPGQIVSVELLPNADTRRQVTGRVKEVLGDHLAPGMEIAIALRSYDLPHEWSSAVKKEIAGLSDTLSDQDYAGHDDLRELAFVTIDGEDSRDFDDAVYCEAKPRGGWLLRVAIADVSHYVKPGSALDDAAQQRSTSVYFPGEVIPMLPECLSNGLCSLNPHCDRLCLVCEMTINAAGKITKVNYQNAVIHSQARLTYTQVADYLENDNVAALPADNAEQLIEPLQQLYSVYQQLHRCRKARGAIEFDTPEPYFLFDENRKIESVVAKTRNVAHRLIEECMLAANISAAKFLIKHKIPTLFRVHEPPKQEKLTRLRTFLSDLGLKLAGGSDPSPKDYDALIERINDRPDATLIQIMLLRSMSLAVYQPENKGHFGLAYKQYTHFTSPIRRYPDLLVHRAIKHCLARASLESFPYTWEAIKVLGEHSSMAERRADEASRDVVDWLKCEFMQDKVGQCFDGIINGVTGFGLFVQLTDVFIEGLIHVTALRNDYYHFDHARQTLTGERSGKRYRLRDTLRVRVIRVDLDERQIDFELAD